MARIWLWDRMRCYFQGHRGLGERPMWAGKLPDGRVEEVYLCTACNSPVWKIRRPEELPSPLREELNIGLPPSQAPSKSLPIAHHQAMV